MNDTIIIERRAQGPARPWAHVWTVADAATAAQAPTVTASGVIRLVYQNEGPAMGQFSGNFAAMERLAAGWDGYDAPPPSAQAIAVAKSLVHDLVQAEAEPSRLAPSVVGGVGVTRKRGRRRVYIEVANDGTIAALFTDGQDEPRTRIVPAGYQPFRALAREMREYLDG